MVSESKIKSTVQRLNFCFKYRKRECGIRESQWL